MRLHQYMFSGIKLALLPYLAMAALSVSAQYTNVVLILADDLAFDNVGCYGSTDFSTPNIDQLSSAGVRFENCHASPICTPSRVKILTGRSGVRNYWNFGNLTRTEKTFGHMMKDAGYATAIAGKWQLGKTPGTVNGTYPSEAGFDEWCVRHEGKRYWAAELDVNGTTTNLPSTAYGPDFNCDYIIDFIERNANVPFFAYYPTVLPHGPFDPTPDSVDPNETDDLTNYKDMIAYMDKNVGRIVDRLDQLGLLDNTVVIVTADNGTNHEITYNFLNEIRHGQKGETADGGTHVPLVVYGAGVASGLVHDDIVDFTDIFPTLASITGASHPANVTIDGESFWTLCQGSSSVSQNFVFQFYEPRPPHLTEPWMAPYLHPGQEWAAWVQDKNYKLYSNGLFFDVANDRLQTNNIPLGTGTAAEEDLRNKMQNKLYSMITTTNGAPLLYFREYGIKNDFDASAALGSAFTNMYELHANLDLDGEGLNGYQEYQVGSDPLDKNSPSGDIPPAFSASLIQIGDAYKQIPYSATLHYHVGNPSLSPLTYTKISGPDWLTIASDGTLSGTPASADWGANLWKIKVSDGTSVDKTWLKIRVRNTVEADTGEASFIPQNDSWTKEGSTVNYGDRDVIGVRYAPPLNRIAYVQFEVTSAVVDTAKLSLYPRTTFSDLKVWMARHNSWDEAYVTGENQPALDAQVAAVTTIQDGVPLEIDVASYIPGPGIYTFALTTDEAGDLKEFDSKEGANPPQLIINEGASASMLIFAGMGEAVDGLPRVSNYHMQYD